MKKILNAIAIASFVILILGMVVTSTSYIVKMNSRVDRNVELIEDGFDSVRNDIRELEAKILDCNEPRFIMPTKIVTR